MKFFYKKILSWFYPVRIETVHGELDHVLEVNLYRGKLFLDTEQVNYSYGALQEVFDHAFQSTQLYDRDIRSGLILGFGSGCVAELLLSKCYDRINITGVEADQEVIRLTKEYFPIGNNTRISIIHNNAMKFVVNERNRYDLIVVDLFVEDEVPHDCRQPAFLKQLHELLNSKGSVYFNIMNRSSEADEIADFEKTFSLVFRNTRSIKVHRGGEGNTVVVGCA